MLESRYSTTASPLPPRSYRFIMGAPMLAAALDRRRMRD
jgi:hypothetical protein